MSNSTTPKLGDKAAVLKAARKHKDKDKVPLLAHATMRWGRKVNGRIVYFGKVDGTLPDFGAGAAMEEYHRTIGDIREGRQPRPKDSDLITLADAANVFLSAKAALRDSGELSPRTWTDYHATCARIIGVLGKHRAVADLDPADFRKLRTTFAKGRGAVSLSNDVRRSRVFFKFCEKEGLIDRPCRFGAGFDLPSPKTLRVARAAKGARMFQPEEMRLLLDKADPVLKAQILLGVNCAFGQSDLARVPKAAIDFGGGWIEYGRQKTGVPRRCPLWAETVDAVKAAIALRPEAHDAKHKNLVFLTPAGHPVVRDVVPRNKEKAEAGATTHLDTVSQAFTALLKAVGLNGCRGFYALRHTFQTIGEQTGDFPAVSAIMGHAPKAGDMSAVYRERIDDARLIAVSNHVRAWLWPDGCVAE